MIGWTIEQALQSQYIDKVIVSTDDKEIAHISRQFSAETPYLRPVELATDGASSVDVVLHAVEWFEKKDTPYDLILLLQPTSPCRTSKDIDNAIKLIFSKNAKAIVSVCEVDHSPYWANILPDNGCMKEFLRTEIKDKNRQELLAHYRLNGAIYLAYSDYVKSQKSFFGIETYAYIMSKEKSVDIDDEIDFVFAEFLLQKD